MSFRDLDEFFDDTLHLPIKGKTYVVQSPSAKVGLMVQGMMAVAADARAGRDVDPDDLQALKLDDDEERDFSRQLLGDAYDQLLGDKVGWHRVQHVTQTVIFWIVRGKEFAEAYWNGAGDPKAAAAADPSSTENEDPPASPASSTSPDETTGSATPGPTS